MLISLCVAPFCRWFWRPSHAPNLLQVDLLEMSICLLSKTSVISKFGLHLPIQNWVLPTLLIVCPKRGRKVIFEVFFDLFGSSKHVKISWPYEGIHIFPWKTQKFWVFLKRRSLKKSCAKWPSALCRKTYFLGQKFQNCKNFPKFLEIWAECSSSGAVLG